jgi:hypothetical protein
MLEYRFKSVCTQYLHLHNLPDHDHLINQYQEELDMVVIFLTDHALLKEKKKEGTIYACKANVDAFGTI